MLEGEYGRNVKQGNHTTEFWISDLQSHKQLTVWLEPMDDEEVIDFTTLRTDIGDSFGHFFSVVINTDDLRFLILQELEVADVMTLKHAALPVLLVGTKMRMSTQVFRGRSWASNGEYDKIGQNIVERQERKIGTTKND